MKIILLKYGNTNTYLVGRLLVDTDMAGTLPAFRRELKKQGVALSEIGFVVATHYHPDHMGLIGDLMQSGVRLLLLEHQKDFVHSPDAIYAKEKRSDLLPIDESGAVVITAEESRGFLASIGIAGELLPTKSHSQDGVALILDDGNAFVGDLEPREFLGGYAENDALREDWETLASHGVKTVHYGHANEQTVKNE